MKLSCGRESVEDVEAQQSVGGFLSECRADFSQTEINVAPEASVAPSTLVVSCRRCWSSSPITIKTLPPEINRQREAGGVAAVGSHTESNSCQHSVTQDIYSVITCHFHFSTSVWKLHFVKIYSTFKWWRSSNSRTRVKDRTESYSSDFKGSDATRN